MKAVCVLTTQQTAYHKHIMLREVTVISVMLSVIVVVMAMAIVLHFQACSMTAGVRGGVASHICGFRQCHNRKQPSTENQDGE